MLVHDKVSPSIQHILRFSPDDLVMNRQLRLSRGQDHRLHAKRRSMRRLLVLIGLLWAGGVGGFLVAEARKFHDAGNPDWKGLVASAAIFILSGLPLIYLGVRPRKPISVATVRGPIRLARVERTRRSSSTSYTYVATELHIGGQIFTIPDAAYGALEDGASYAVYYWDRAREILSIEKV